MLLFIIKQIITEVFCAAKYGIDYMFWESSRTFRKPKMIWEIYNEEKISRQYLTKLNNHVNILYY